MNYNSSVATRCNWQGNWGFWITGHTIRHLLQLPQFIQCSVLLVIPKIWNSPFFFYHIIKIYRCERANIFQTFFIVKALTSRMQSSDSKQFILTEYVWTTWRFTAEKQNWLLLWPTLSKTKRILWLNPNNNLSIIILQNRRMLQRNQTIHLYNLTDLIHQNTALFGP